MTTENNIKMPVQEQDHSNYDHLTPLSPLRFFSNAPCFDTWCNLKLSPIHITSETQDQSQQDLSPQSLSPNQSNIKNMDQIINSIKTEISQKKNYLFEAFCNNEDLISFEPITPYTNTNNQQQQQEPTPQLPIQNYYNQQLMNVKQTIPPLQIQQFFGEKNACFSTNPLIRQISQQINHNQYASAPEERKIQTITEFPLSSKILGQYEIINANSYQIQSSPELSDLIVGGKRPRRRSTEQKKNYCEDSVDELESTSDEKYEKRVPCNCKKSKCLKLYCECFAAGLMCMKECNCCDCNNLDQFARKRDIAINMLLEKNPSAFMTKIVKPSILYQVFTQQQQLPQQQPQTSLQSQISTNSQQTTQASIHYESTSEEEEQHIKGCNCKKSHCLKKYCECYNGGVKCSSLCKCEGCKNGNQESDQEDNNEDNISEYNDELDETDQQYKPRKYVKRENKNNKNVVVEQKTNEEQFQELEQNIKNLRQKFQNGQFIQSAV